MLSDQERVEVEAALSHAETTRAAATDALKAVQRRRGWVSDETLADVASLLGLTACELDSIATCYNGIYRRPVGRHVILLCDSVSCCIMGYDFIREHLKTRLGIGLGETTADGRFTLLPVACLGLCESAPAMLIDDNVHGDLTPEKMDRILAAYP